VSDFVLFRAGLNFKQSYATIVLLYPLSFCDSKEVIMQFNELSGALGFLPGSRQRFLRPDVDVRLENVSRLLSIIDSVRSANSEICRLRAHLATLGELWHDEKLMVSRMRRVSEGDYLMKMSMEQLHAKAMRDAVSKLESEPLVFYALTAALDGVVPERFSVTTKLL